MKRFLLQVYLLLFNGLLYAQVQQISISRIELMPNAPSPYLMRDWGQVTKGYDSLVFDIAKTRDCANNAQISCKRKTSSAFLN
ncbi:MAG: hypothetical protein L3J06_06985 [Cyclobacteriaceae bacterium]|nr:hypothetical protein [Cyclobacteriaceae bacterium]